MKRYSTGIAAGALIAAALLAAACSGSGSPSGGLVPHSGHRIGHVAVTLHVPRKAHQSARTVRYLQHQEARRQHNVRRPRYFSGATTEIDFVLNTESGSAAPPSDQATYDFTMYTSNSSECTGGGTSAYDCHVTEPAPAGPDTYLVRAEQCSAAGSGPGVTCASLGGTLTLLSASYVPITVIADQTVAAAFTMSPVVGSIDWGPVTYATVSGPSPLPSALWLPQPNGTAAPTYVGSSSIGYVCGVTSSGSPVKAGGNGCFQPVTQGTSVAYGVVLEARDPDGALIVGASNGGTIYQTPVYLDSNGNAITIHWSCYDAASGVTSALRRHHSLGRPHAVAQHASLTWETGGGPYLSNASATKANNTFNSPVLDPSSDPDGGNTADANGNPVAAVGDNGIEINWDGIDQPLAATPDYCTASTSNGLSTTLNWFAGPGVTPSPSPSPSAVPTSTPSPTPSPQSAFASAIEALAPLAYYRLGETSGTTAFDSGGGGYNGVYVGNPTLGVPGLVSGDPNTAIETNGTNQYVSLPALPFSVAGSGRASQAFTIVAVIDPSKTSGIIATYRGFSLGLSGGEIGMYTSFLGFFALNGPAISTGTPHFVAISCVCAGTNYSVLTYLDSNAHKNGNPGAYGSNTPSASSYLGYASGASVGSYGGVLDEVAIFRSVLSSSQISNLASDAGY